MNPRVSIIIPCYNADKWIAFAIDSALRQNYDNIEIIVVDDGSIDRTHDVLAGYGNKIRIIKQTNHGVSAARNNGVAEATGVFVKFLDADDVLERDAITCLVETVGGNDEKIAVGRAKLINESGISSNKVAYNIMDPPLHLKQIEYWLLITQALHVGICLFPRKAFIASGGFDVRTRLGEEYNIIHNLIKLGYNFYYCDEIVYSVREHGGHRLSRVAGASDFLAQLHTIMIIIDELSIVIGEPPSWAKQKFSTIFWSSARECYRRGFWEAGDRHIIASRHFIPGGSVVGSYPYKMLLMFFGPRYAEIFLCCVKPSYWRSLLIRSR